MPASSCNHVGGGGNLIVFIDGTASKISTESTNVLRLCQRVASVTERYTYFSGIGTAAERSGWQRRVNSIVDRLVAWNIEMNVRKAYEWLSLKYEKGDQIYLFGFSRGAYQVRILAAMINKVGLIKRGFAEGGSAPDALDWYLKPEDEAEWFKRIYSRDVKVHFVGVWDTVSAVQRHFPLTETADHICRFRHALALDEQRSDFLPEYVQMPQTRTEPTDDEPIPHVKEVWFPGVHSDIGGKRRDVLNNTRAPDVHTVAFMWMIEQARLCGLAVPEKPGDPDPTNYLDGIRGCKIESSLKHFWYIREVYPHSVSTYNGEKPRERRLRFNFGRGRPMKPHQKLHISVASYRSEPLVVGVPKATLPSNDHNWDTLVNTAHEILTGANLFELKSNLRDGFEHDAYNPASVVRAIDALGNATDEQKIHFILLLENGIKNSRLAKHREEILGRLSEVLVNMPAGDAKTRLGTLYEGLEAVVRNPGSSFENGGAALDVGNVLPTNGPALKPLLTNTTALDIGNSSPTDSQVSPDKGITSQNQTRWDRNDTGQKPSRHMVFKFGWHK